VLPWFIILVLTTSIGVLATADAMPEMKLAAKWRENPF
jgi:hypothetical protein